MFVASEYELYKTEDAGVNWITLIDKNIRPNINGKPGNVYGIRGTYFLSKTSGYLFTNRGVVLKTTDGGNNWNKLYDDDIYVFNSIYCFDDGKFVLAGKFWKQNKGVIISTNNDCANYTTTVIDGNYLNSVYFSDYVHGYVVGSNGIIKKTDDHGTSWYDQAGPSNINLNSVFFPSTNTGYIVGDWNSTAGSTVLKTDNGGQTWNNIPLTFGENLTSVFFLDNNNGYIGGSGSNLFKTTNGFSSWSNLNLPLNIESVNNWDQNYARDFCTYHNGMVHYTDNILVYPPSNHTHYSALQIAVMHASTYGIHWSRYSNEDPQIRHYPKSPSDPPVINCTLKDWCYYNLYENMTIPTGTNVTFNSPRFLSGDLIIQDGATLTIKSFLSMPNGGEIYVEKGGKLIVDGGYITNECGLMWGGIVVLGDKTISQGSLLSNTDQGYVYLKNGAKIEHAQIGVDVGYFALNEMHNGGILIAEGCTFINCGIGVRFYPYNSPTRPSYNYSYFKNCSFIASEPLPPASSNKYTTVFVKLDNVRGISFYNNTFKNTTQRTDKGTIGIQSENSSFLVQKLFLSGEQPCTPPQGDLTNIFQGLEIGIDIKNTMDQRIAKIFGNKFIDVTIGIKAENDENTIIYSNDFNYTSDFRRITRQPNPIAINFNKSSRTIIDENKIYNTPSSFLQIGIHSLIPSLNCSIKNNEFNGGVLGSNYLIGNFLSGDHPNTYVLCNEYSNNYYDWVIDNYSQICDQYTSLNPDFGAGNIFDACYSSNNIYNLGYDFNYYSGAIICTTPNVHVIGSPDPNCTKTSPCTYYTYFVLDPTDPYIPDHSLDKAKMIFKKIYAADFTGASVMIEELNPETQANLIQLLTISKNVFSSGRNFWQLNDGEISSLLLLANHVDESGITYNIDESGIYAQNILSFYQDFVFARDSIMIEEQPYNPLLPEKTGLTSKTDKNNFMIISPNPSEESFSINYNVPVSKTGYTISIYDGLGKIKKELSLNNNQGSVIILNSELGADGMYFVILKSGFVVKFTKSVLLK